MPILDRSKRYYAKDRKTWRKWLEKNHATAEGIWLVYYKQCSGKSRVPYADAVEEALCFGWIDTTSNPIDEDSYMQLFTPRKSKSTWSKLNKERVEKLIAEGSMTEAGIAKIEEAKKNGSWTSLDKVEAFELPPELKKAFATNKKAKIFFDELGKTNKKYILYHINSAKRAETRQARVDEIVAAANEGRMLDRWVAVKPKKEK